MSRRNRTKSKNIIRIYVIAVIALLVIVYILPRVTDSINKTALVEYGTIEVAEETLCVIVRSEKLFVSELEGETKYKVDEGAKVRKTAHVMEVTGYGDSSANSKYVSLAEKAGDRAINTHEYTAGINGVVSYSSDGMEGILTPAAIKELKRTDAKNMTNSYIDLKRKKVNAGEAVYRVYDNSKWYMVLWTDKKLEADYEEGNTVDVCFPEAEITAVVKSKTKQGGSYKIVLYTDRYYEKLSQSRVEDVKIVLKDYSGLIIDNGSITEKDNMKGVYIKSGAREYTFRPINILFTDGEQSVISENYFYDKDGIQFETVKLYDEILKNP